MTRWPNWPNERGWIGIGTFALTIMILWMIKEDPTLRDDEFFKTIATLVIGTGFISGPVAWAYSATKGGSEAAESNARIAESATGVPEATKPAPKDAIEAAEQVGDAATEAVDNIKGTKP